MVTTYTAAHRDLLRRAITATREVTDPLVQAIEASPETTKGHYGDYLALLAGRPAREAMLTALACILGGANRDAVQVALALSQGHHPGWVWVDPSDQPQGWDVVDTSHD